MIVLQSRTGYLGGDCGHGEHVLALLPRILVISPPYDVLSSEVEVELEGV